MKALKISGLSIAALLILVLPASAHVRFGGGAVVVPTIAPWSWYGPFWGWPGPYGVYPGAIPNAGEIKLKTNVKDADVYVNGAYAGKAAKLKTLWLRADTYDVEVRAPGRAPFLEKIYVVPGKTTHIDAEFPSVSQS